MLLLLLVEGEDQHDNVITLSAILHLGGTSGSHAFIFRGKNKHRTYKTHEPYMHLVCILPVLCDQLLRAMQEHRKIYRKLKFVTNNATAQMGLSKQRPPYVMHPIWFLAFPPILYVYT